MGGKFTFSDDSHGIAQVATNYHRGLDYLESLGVQHVYTFGRGPQLQGEPGGIWTQLPLEEKAISVKEFRDSLKL
jgi:histidinol-phosphatase (PHP family)